LIVFVFVLLNDVLLLLYIKKGFDEFVVFIIDIVLLLLLENGTKALLLFVLLLENGTKALLLLVSVLENGTKALSLLSSSLIVNKDDWLFNPKLLLLLLLLLKSVDDDDGIELKFDEEESVNGENIVDEEFFWVFEIFEV